MQGREGSPRRAPALAAACTSTRTHGQPAEGRVGIPVLAFSPLRVGFLQIFRRSKSEMKASEKSTPSRSALSKLVPVST